MRREPRTARAVTTPRAQASSVDSPRAETRRTTPNNCRDLQVRTARTGLTAWRLVACVGWVNRLTRLVVIQVPSGRGGSNPSRRTNGNPSRRAVSRVKCSR